MERTEEEKRDTGEMRATVGTYYYYWHAMRAVKPGEQSPEEHFQRVE